MTASLNLEASHDERRTLTLPEHMCAIMHMSCVCAKRGHVSGTEGCSTYEWTQDRWQAVHIAGTDERRGHRRRP